MVSPNTPSAHHGRALHLLSLWLLVASWPSPAAARQLNLKVDERDVDIATRTIHFRLNAPVADAQLKIYSAEGSLLHQATTEFSETRPGQRLSVRWPELGKEGENFRLELLVTDDKQMWVSFEVVRFYLEIPHEDVTFPSAKWTIEDDQAPKLVDPLDTLKDAVKRYGAIMQVRLYVAGHTDTVGAPADNERLSEKRAHAIAAYFMEHGLKNVQIFVRGFGEGSPLVKTADSVNEVRNRRAQYIVSTFTPQIPGPGSWRRVQ